MISDWTMAVSGPNVSCVNADEPDRSTSSMSDLGGGGKQLVRASGAEHVCPAIRRLGEAPAHDALPVEQELAHKLCPVGRRELRFCVRNFVTVLSVQYLGRGIRV